MIATGLSWRMAIGACVLGNTIMGLVITINGRIGATVSLRLLLKVLQPSLLSVAPHSLSCSCSYAIWLLLQLLRDRVPLCSCHHLARVSPCPFA